jgi:DNA-binding LytR/AlgR family response regulator
MKKILIVEDQIDTLMDLEGIVLSQGFIAVKAVNQKEAFKIIDSDDSLPDLAFLDIKLPDNESGGIEIARHIRKMKHIPIIFVTGNRSDNIDKIKHLASQIIEKPFTNNQIIDAINSSFKEDLLKESADIKIFSKDKLVVNCDNTEPDYKGQKWHQIINVKEICYIKGEGNFCRIVLSDNHSIFLSTEKSHFDLFVKKVMDDYDDYFMYKNKNYIINTKKVRAFDRESIWFVGVTRPIRYPQAKAHLDEYLVVSTRKNP